MYCIHYIDTSKVRGYDSIFPQDTDEMVTVGMQHQLQSVENLTLLSQQLVKQQHRMISCQSVIIVKFLHINVIQGIAMRAPQVV